MRAPRRVISLFVLFLAGAFASTAAFPVFAGGPGGGASPKPKPDVQRKVYTNEDLEAMAALYGGPAAQNPAVPGAATKQATGTSAEVPTFTALPHDQNPVWYAQQAATMQTELDNIDGELAALNQPPASATTTGGAVSGGFGLYTCCPGVTTYNRISMLVQQRQEIAAQMNVLEDTSRVNGFPPGMLRDSNQILQAAENRVTVTPQERAADLAENEQALSSKLAQVQGTLRTIREQAAAQNIALATPTTAYGGSMLTNDIVDLDSQAGGLRQKISDIQAAARANGTAPGAQP